MAKREDLAQRPSKKIGSDPMLQLASDVSLVHLFW